MNIQHIRDVFHSFDIQVTVSSDRHRQFFKDGHFCIAPMAADWFKDNPRRWEIHQVIPARIFQASVTDEFELQDWLINEC